MNTIEGTLPWLLRLRWAAITGQAATIIYCVEVMNIRLPLRPLLLVLAVTVVSQLVLYFCSRWLKQPSQRFIGSWLSLDTLILTAMLYFTGGPNNPFSTFYLIHIAMAASLLGAGWTWGLLGLALACFGGLFWRNVPLPYPTSADPICGRMPMPLHLTGMFFALALTGLCLAWFVARLNALLREQATVLHAAEMKAEREARFASLVTLAAGVAHEINSPLATIAVVARDLEREAELTHLPENVMNDTRLIRKEVERCGVILRRLHAHAGDGPHDPPVDCRADELVVALRASLPTGQADRLECSSRNTEVAFRAPRAALLQALSSLVSNALDAAPPGSPVHLDFSRDKNDLIVTVGDEGPGLSAEVADRVGEPFVTTKEPGQGTGLGLFLVRRFAEQMGGGFDIQSTPGTGTRARLKIPQGSAI